MAEVRALVARIISGSEIAVNAGSDSGVQKGDRVTVWRSVEITDPKTGDSLGSYLRAQLRLEVSLVDERFSLARVRIEVPNFTANIFGRQTKFITGAGVDDEHVPLKVGDDVTIVTREAESDTAE
jgi:hypothetical protein